MLEHIHRRVQRRGDRRGRREEHTEEGAKGILKKKKERSAAGAGPRTNGRSVEGA